MSTVHVRTRAPDGSGTRYLGTYGPVSGLKYSFTLPSGCEQASWTLGVPARQRDESMDPGRRVECVLGAGVTWDGILDEPTPPAADGAGWSMTARGSGTWGASWVTEWNDDQHYADGVPDTAISLAIARGLDWAAPAIGHPAGMYLGQAPDQGMTMIDAMLNQICDGGALVWQVRRSPAGNIPEVYQLPTTPNRLLICTDPAGRTLGGDVNALRIRYCSVPDQGAGFPARYSLTWATDDASIAKHGRMEEPLDLSSNGVMLAADAQAIGAKVLAKYQRASYDGPFTARAGQLLTAGGQPMDLAAYWQGEGDPPVCKLLLLDEGYGGEVTPGPVVFVIGRYEYDQDAQTATITPYQTAAEDFSGLLAAAAAKAKGRKWYGQHWGPREMLWWFAGSNKIHERWGPPRRHHRRHRRHHTSASGTLR